jgi:hypothetical protein
MQAKAENKISIYGPKADGTALAISVPAGETRVLKYFQERMPHGLFVPDAP